MAETAAVSKEVSMAVGNELKCGLDPPKPECNGTNHHSQANDLENSYVFVSGADALDSRDVVAEGSNATVESGKTSDVHIEEVNGNVERINVFTVEGLTGKTESSTEGKVEQVEKDSEQDNFDEIVKSGPAPQIGSSSLAAGWGENGVSNDISPHVDSSVIANGEYSNPIETLEACQGSQDVVVGVVQHELQHVRVGEVVETNGASSLTASLDVDLESNPIVIEGETDGVQDVADLSMKAKNEVNLSGKVVENGEHDESLSNPLDLDLESKTINGNKETNIVGDPVQGESRDVSVNARDEVKLLEEVIKSGEHEVLPSSTSSDVDLESNPRNSKEETDMAEVVEWESHDVSTKDEEEVKLSGDMLENAEHEVPKSIPLDLDMELGSINTTEETNSSDLAMESHPNGPIDAKEETEVVEDVVDCELQDVSFKVEDETKLSGEVAETADLKMPLSTSFDVVLESNPIYNSEEMNVIEDAVDCELQGVGVKAGNETKLSGEAVEIAELKVPPSTFFGVALESNPINGEEELYVIEDVVECGSQDVRSMADDEVKSSGEVLKIAESEVPPSVSLDLDLESYPTNTKEEAYVERELQDVSAEANDDVKSPREVVQTSEHEIPLSTSLDVDLESKTVNIPEEKDVVGDFVERELQEVCLKDHTEDEKNLSCVEVDTAEHEIPPSTSLDTDLESITINGKGEINVVENVVERDIQDVNVNAGDEVKLSGEVVKTAEHKIPPSAPLDVDLLTKNGINTKEETDVVEDDPECEFNEVKVKSEYEKPLGDVLETAEHEVPISTSSELDVESHLIDKKEETDVTMEVVECESQDSTVKAKDEVKLLDEVIETTEHEVPLSNSLDLDLDSEPKPINREEKINVVVNAVECESQNATLEGNDEVNLSGEVLEIAEHEVTSSTSLDFNLESNPTTTKEDMGAVAKVVEINLHDVSVKTEGEVNLLGEVVEIEEHKVPSSTSDSSDPNKEGAANIELEIEDVEDKVGQIDGAPGNSNENLPLGENADTGNSQDNNTHVAPPKGSTVHMTDREEAIIKTKRKPFNYMIRVPRFDDESLKEQVRLAKLNIDEKTKLRDAIQVQIQEKRASTQIHGIDYEYAKVESRNARKLVRLKRIEIDSLQSVINKAKNALSIEDIDSQMYNMERMIQHETLPLKEEKQIIREIKQLKQLREQLSSNMGSQDEIKQALEQKGEAEGRLKILRKELDVLKDKVFKAEAAALEAGKKYEDENRKVKEIQAQFRAADDVRQAAYVQWQSLRKELSKKNEYFFKYKDDATVARNYAFSNDTDSLYRLCTNNVERFMALWNTSDEFRRDYTKFNARSTVWRLGNLDGRSLGPGELPPVLHSYDNARVKRITPTPVKVDIASQFPALEVVKRETTTETVEANSKSMKKVTEEKIQSVTNKVTEEKESVSVEDITHEEIKKSREKVEEVKKSEETESMLKEQRRLEELAKATEARERKKKQVEKFQMRAELKTLKEAEQKEKEREKRQRKKERKKAAASDASDTNTSEIGSNCESAVETTTKKVEVKETISYVGPNKKAKNQQSKTKSSIPPQLRNRNKKKLQQWIWVGITSVIILASFWMGNIGVFSNLSFKARSTLT